MNEQIAISGVLSGYRTTADGGLKITIELDELQSAKFHDLFPGINLTVAVVRLTEETLSEKG
ncbi:MAG: hypothetical protein JWN63_3435 [Candidatus Acidoferrum typicum]|nr:hypothetical protein [Candidatus Acidoferrum typicum]